VASYLGFEISCGSPRVNDALYPSKSGLVNKHTVKHTMGKQIVKMGSRGIRHWKQEATLQACPLNVSLRLDTTLLPADSKVKSAISHRFQLRFGQDVTMTSDVSPVPRIALAGCYEPTC
jgi:hypothetical protein